jgi:hypothetical protein
MRLISSFAILIFVFLAVSCPAFSQTEVENCQDNRGVCAYQKPLRDLLNAAQEQDFEKRKTKTHDALAALLAPERVPDYFVLALSEGLVFDNVVNAWERARVDKQVGTSAKGAGTTDLASRPSTPELIGLAMQLGALTETVSGSTATLNANAYGAYQALIGQPAICLVCSKSAWTNINFAASFDLSRQATKQVPTSGVANTTTPAVDTVQLPQSSRQLSSVTVRYDIYNPLDPRSKEFKKAWSTAFQKHQQDLADAAKELDDALRDILKPLLSDNDLQSLENTYLGTLTKDANKFAADAANKNAAKADAAKLDKDFEEYFTQLSKIAHNDVPDLDQKLSVAASAYSRFSQINYTAVQEARGKPQFTAEYIFNHPVTQPDTHDFKLIYGFTPKSKTGVLFTLNLAGSIYGGSIPSGAKYGRLRDFQFAAQLDRPLGDVITHPATFTLAGYVQYQFDPSVLNIGPGNLVPGTSITLPSDAQVLLGTKGTLGIVQAKITVNTKSGVNIPIGVSWANKTDLLNATDVRGHVGITYDFNSIGQLFGH